MDSCPRSCFTCASSKRFCLILQLIISAYFTLNPLNGLRQIRVLYLINKTLFLPIHVTLNCFCYRYGKAVASAYVQGILTSEPRDISLLFFLWYLHSGGGKPCSLVFPPSNYQVLIVLASISHKDSTV